MKFHFLLFLAILGLYAPLALSQTTAAKVAYIKEHALVIHNTEPTNETYADLAPLKAVLSQVEVVGLGEQTHYDGHTFKAKTRLVKFLHQEMGYEVLAFESGFYDTYKAWQDIQIGKPAQTAARKSIYGLWITAETEELFKYIDSQKNTARPLILAGIDCKFSGDYAKETLLSDLEAYLRSFNAKVLQDSLQWAAFGKSMLRVIEVSDYMSKPSAADTLNAQRTLGDMLSAIEEKTTLAGGASQEDAFWRQFCKSTLTEATKRYSKAQVRDRQMGENLLFLKDELYKDKKMMVWAASSHLTYDGENIERTFYQQNLRLGDYIKQAYGDKYYNIGFTGYEGKIGKLLFFPLIKVKKHKENSIEHLLGQTGQPFLLLDLNKPNLPGWLQAHIIARPFGYKEISMRLPQVMDGLFYTRDIFQGRPVPVAKQNL
jgi:erythromycin esterase